MGWTRRGGCGQRLAIPPFPVSCGFTQSRLTIMTMAIRGRARQIASHVISFSSVLLIYSLHDSTRYLWRGYVVRHANTGHQLGGQVFL